MHSGQNRNALSEKSLNKDGPPWSSRSPELDPSLIKDRSRTARNQRDDRRVRVCRPPEKQPKEASVGGTLKNFISPLALGRFTQANLSSKLPALSYGQDHLASQVRGHRCDLPDPLGTVSHAQQASHMIGLEACRHQSRSRPPQGRRSSIGLRLLDVDSVSEGRFSGCLDIV